MRSLGPGALSSCLQGMSCSGWLTTEVLASLGLQFLPILAQRVQRKQEKLNRKAVWREKPLMKLVKSACRHLPEVSGTQRVS